MTGTVEIMMFLAKLASAAAYFAQPGWEATSPNDQIECRHDGKTAFCGWVDPTVQVLVGCRQSPAEDIQTAICAAVVQYQGQAPAKPTPVFCTFAKEGDQEPICVPGRPGHIHAKAPLPRGQRS